VNRPVGGIRSIIGAPANGRGRAETDHPRHICAIYDNA